VEGHASISTAILARYAADAARDVAGVRDLVDNALHRQRGVRVVDDEDGVSVELPLAVAWGASAPDVAREVQRRVRDYLVHMADVRPRAVDVVVAEIG
jgi:uncharacterized alkaline shock family protein YloU